MMAYYQFDLMWVCSHLFLWLGQNTSMSWCFEFVCVKIQNEKYSMYVYQPIVLSATKNDQNEQENSKPTKCACVLVDSFEVVFMHSTNAKSKCVSHMFVTISKLEHCLWFNHDFSFQPNEMCCHWCFLWMSYQFFSSYQSKHEIHKFFTNLLFWFIFTQTWPSWRVIKNK